MVSEEKKLLGYYLIFQRMAKKILQKWKMVTWISRKKIKQTNKNFLYYVNKIK